MKKFFCLLFLLFPFYLYAADKILIENDVNSNWKKAHIYIVENLEDPIPYTVMINIWDSWEEEESVCGVFSATCFKTKELAITYYKNSYNQFKNNYIPTYEEYYNQLEAFYVSYPGECEKNEFIDNNKIITIYINNFE